MQKHFQAIYENGVFKPLTPPELPEHKTVHLILEEEEECSLYLETLAMQGQSFDFLKDSKEDVYSPSDGSSLT